MSVPMTSLRIPRNAGQLLQQQAATRRGWKVYTYLLVGFQLISLPLADTYFRAESLVDLPVTAVGIAGLFGFAYRRRVLVLAVCRVWGIFLPLWDFVMAVWVYASPDLTSSSAYSVFVLVIFLPEYVALFRYAYWSGDLWVPLAVAG